MQAVKDKIGEMTATKMVKEEARAEERAEKEIAKARGEVAHEVRLAKEAEATMVHHVAKAGEIAREGERLAHEQMAKLGGTNNDASSGTVATTNMSPPTYNKMS